MMSERTVAVLRSPRRVPVQAGYFRQLPCTQQMPRKNQSSARKVRGGKVSSTSAGQPAYSNDSAAQTAVVTAAGRDPESLPQCARIGEGAQSKGTSSLA